MQKIIDEVEYKEVKKIDLKLGYVGAWQNLFFIQGGVVLRVIVETAKATSKGQRHDVRSGLKWYCRRGLGKAMVYHLLITS
jgi:hypothetical protein